ncbi:hypothetical protein RND81_03G034800 [Saponaria officinalis]|uniref:Uncharacterized protein n=1 Tax=Saponaria officinalis TaxID=3572 RepID=A0AAW1M4C5_SAPOF
MSKLKDEALPPIAHNMSNERGEPRSSISKHNAFNSDAHQVFNEMPMSNSCLNHVQLVETSLDGIQIPLIAVSSSLAGHHKTKPKPMELVVTSNEFQVVLNVDKATGRCENNVLEAYSENVDEDCYLSDKVNEVVCNSCDWVEEGLLSFAYKMFDKMLSNDLRFE